MTARRKSPMQTAKAIKSPSKRVEYFLTVVSGKFQTADIADQLGVSAAVVRKAAKSIGWRYEAGWWFDLRGDCDDC